MVNILVSNKFDQNIDHLFWYCVVDQEYSLDKRN